MRRGLDRPARRRLAALLAAAGLGLGAWLTFEGDSVWPPIGRVAAGEPGSGVRTAASPAPEAALPRLDLAKLERPKTYEVSGELFGAAPEAAPPPPPVTVAPPPPPPEPPALPFRFLGRMTEKGELRVFLGRGETTHTVRVGDTLGGTYRVESISADAVVFTFLPMNARQTLSIASAQ